MGYRETLLALAPGGYWRCDELAGNLADSSGNRNTATANGAGISYGVAGALARDADTAISLPGVNTNYFSIANNAAIDVANVFTIIWWVKKAANDANMTIAGRGTNGWEIRCTSTNQVQVLKCFVAAIVTSTRPITDTDWHMIAWTKDGLTNHLYVDGEDVTGTITVSDPDQTLVATGGTTTIGRNGQDGALPWNGSLDDGAIIKGTALTAAQIVALYREGILGAALYESIALNATAGVVAVSTSLASRPSVKRSLVSVEGAAIRYTVDGTTPTATLGHLALPGDAIRLENRDELRKFRAIRQGALPARIRVTCRTFGPPWS